MFIALMRYAAYEMIRKSKKYDSPVTGELYMRVD